jgi:WD40 repeat protein
VGGYINSGSLDGSSRNWDAQTSVAISKTLEGHTGWVRSVAYSPDGQHVISGSDDGTIRMWDAKTGAAVGMPLQGHTKGVWSVAYSPDGRHIISGSRDTTIQIWNVETGAAVSKPLKGHTHPVRSIAFSPDGQHFISGSDDGTIHVWESFSHVSIQLSSSGNPMHPDHFGRPDSDGWVRDPEGGLLYWVPPDCCTGLHSPALLTIPPTSHTRSISLDFEDFAFGTSWTQIFSSAQP